MDEEEVVESTETSLLEDLTEVFEDAETEDTDATETTTETETEVKETEEDGEEPTTDKAAGDEGELADDGEGEAVPSGINAPIGFSPESREKWKDVPDLVKEQIQKRESEINEAIANTGEYRRTHTALTDLAKSYAPIMAAEGADTPMQAIEGLFRTVAELRVGSPQQRATKMANLIGHYGVDISMLDAALAGAPMPNAEMTALEQMLDQRLAPVNEFLNTQHTTQQNVMENNKAAVTAELKEFSKSAEFLNDVRNDMADLIDLASNRDYKMPFKEAYDKACALHPSVSKIIAERAKNETLVNSGKAAQDKVNASSSIRSGSGKAAAVSTNSSGSLSDDLNSAWDSFGE